MKTLKLIGWIFLGLGIAALLALILGLVVMWLWNWLMPDLFGLPTIDYWRAVGLLLLSHILLRGPSFGRRPRRREMVCCDEPTRSTFRRRFHRHFHDVEAKVASTSADGE